MGSLVHDGASNAARTPTDRQLEVLRFIHRFTIENGMPPTIREIQRHIGARSSHAVMCRLRWIRKKRLIDSDPLKGRALRLTPTAIALVQSSACTGFVDAGLRCVHCFANFFGDHCPFASRHA